MRINNDCFDQCVCLGCGLETKCSQLCVKGRGMFVCLLRTKPNNTECFAVSVDTTSAISQTEESGDNIKLDLGEVKCEDRRWGKLG